MNKELYVSTTPHETKVALVEDDQLAEVYFERENEYTLAGSIYKGRVTRVLPGMQSAFVDVGLERDAFLYVSDFLELQDEDEDGEFGDVKVTGPTLAHANGMIIAEAPPVEEEEDFEDEPEEAAAAEGGEAPQAEGKDAAGAPRWRGRRRRRGRRGGRDRVTGTGETQPGSQTGSQPGVTDSVAGTNTDDFEEELSEREPVAAAPPRKRELRGFEPRGLVVHGLARTVDEPEEIVSGVEAEEEEAPKTEERTVAARNVGVQNVETHGIGTQGGGTQIKAAAESFTPMLLPGESISKYNRTEGEAPAAAPAAASGASEESERGYGRGRDRERGGDRDRGGRGRGGRDRDRGRDRGPGRDREREPREHESLALPQNYTPIVLPGESISKYRGVEPIVTAEEHAPTEYGAPEVTPDAALDVTQKRIMPEAVAQAVEAAAPVADVVPNQHEANLDEPLSNASYSGVSGLPSMTQRHVAEMEDVETGASTAEPAELTQEATQVEAERLAAPSESATHAEGHAQEAHPQETHAEEAHAEATPDEAVQTSEAKPEGRSGRRSWRDRVSKIFATVHEEPGVHGAAGEQEGRETPEAQPAAQERQAEGEAAHENAPRAELKPVSHENKFGSFVIEGGHVEHEEFDGEETEMPALAEHFDRYEDSEPEEDVLEDGNGSQFGAAVRETGEESELEDEEYDFGGEEFEESELLAEEAIEEEEGDEVGEEPEALVAPEAGRPRPERFERPQRRGRRGAPPTRGGGRMRPRQQSRALPLISELLKEGQEILVQIAKEPIGKKGARITSHIALPGRFLVYMPTVNHIGVSRKISSEEERQRLKRIVSSERENGHGGFIVRTAASNIKEDELRADIRFLKHLWTEIRTRAESSKSPSLIYHDLNLVERILRDQVTSDFSQIWVDNESEYERVVRFASRFQPNLVRRIKLYTKDTPLYEQFGINEEINKSLKSKVWLKSGGYIVINQTEALVAIDINTGKYVGKTARLEDTIVKTNCDAVKEIVRQIRLRDLGGIIVVDFIDMDERKNRQKVMQALEEAMKSDRAPSKILQFNDFGLVAITRKRVKQSLERTLGTPCPYCDATGFVKSVQTVCNEIYVEMRKVRRHVESKEVILRVNPEVAKELKAGNGKWLQEMEELLGHPVLVKSDAQLHQEQFDMNH
jgi:ribonuclease G